MLPARQLHQATVQTHADRAVLGVYIRRLDVELDQLRVQDAVRADPGAPAEDVHLGWVFLRSE